MAGAFEDRAVREFEDGYYGRVRGFVRTAIVRKNLEGYDLGPNGGNGKIVDLGGGSGGDAIWLARQGHQVLMIEPSPEMAERARKAVRRHTLEGSVEVACGYPEEVLDSSHDGQYDSVLSHGVLMYLSDPRTHLDVVERLLKSGGLTSIITKGKAAAMQRLIHAGEYAEAEALQVTGRFINNLGIEVSTVDYAVMKKLLGDKALHLSEVFYGVRILSDLDNRLLSDVNSQELARRLAHELELSQDYNTRGMGHMLHFLAWKEPA